MIPVSRPFLSELELENVTNAVKSGWVSSLGAYIDEFERLFAEFCGVEHAISVSNGTVGLHLGLVALGVGDGDEVIVPDLTFVASANAVRMAGATPVFVDVRRDSYCIDTAAVRQAITPRTRAIMPVHLYGHPAEMSAIMAIAREHRLLVVEDAAEAHGATIDGSRVGSLGNCGVFSFYGNKIVTTGEGGAITTNDSSLAARIRMLRDHAMSRETRYWHTELGYNYRMTNLQAALGVAQMKQVDFLIESRMRLLDAYRGILNRRGIETNPAVHGSPVNWLVTAVVEGMTREERDNVMLRMRQSGVDSRPFFIPMTALPMYKATPNPVAAQLSASGFNLPTFVGMTPEQVDKAADVFLRSL